MRIVRGKKEEEKEIKETSKRETVSGGKRRKDRQSKGKVKETIIDKDG